MNSIKEKFKSRTGEDQSFTLSNSSIGKSIPAIRSEYPNYGSSAYITYVYIELESGKILRIDGIHGGEKDSEYIKTFNSILPAFRFD